MSRQEQQQTRSLKYSTYHRSLNEKCYTMDIDWFEFMFDYSGNVIGLLLIDEKSTFDNLTDIQRKVLLYLSDKLKVPALVIKHNLDAQAEYCNMGRTYCELCKEGLMHLDFNNSNEWEFELIDLKSNKIKKMTEEEYRFWLENYKNRLKL